MVKQALPGFALFLLSTIALHAESCTASIYGGEKTGTDYCNKITATGELHDCKAMTAAHKTLPLQSHARVCHNDRCVNVRIYDRGPFIKGRCIDLSPAAARAIGVDGLGAVTVTPLPKGSWGL